MFRFRNFLSVAVGHIILGAAQSDKDSACQLSARIRERRIICVAALTEERCWTRIGLLFQQKRIGRRLMIELCAERLHAFLSDQSRMYSGEVLSVKAKDAAFLAVGISRPDRCKDQCRWEKPFSD